jgi:hypothetical protein
MKFIRELVSIRGVCYECAHLLSLDFEKKEMNVWAEERDIVQGAILTVLRHYFPDFEVQPKNTEGGNAAQ